MNAEDSEEAEWEEEVKDGGIKRDGSKSYISKYKRDDGANNVDNENNENYENDQPVLSFRERVAMRKLSDKN